MMKFKKPLELTYEKDGREYLIYIFQGGAGNYEFKTVRAVTVAILCDYNSESEIGWDTFHPGISACSNLDEYDANLGIIKAVGRADSRYAHYLDFDYDGPHTKESILSHQEEATRRAIETAKRIDRRNGKRCPGENMVKMKFSDFRDFVKNDVAWKDIEGKVKLV